MMLNKNRPTQTERKWDVASQSCMSGCL